MDANPLAAGVSGHPAAAPREPHSDLRRWWGLATGLLLAAYFLEAVFAGALLSGAAWARNAHVLTAGAVIAGSLGAGLTALLTLRRIPHGQGLGWILLAAAALALVQAALGAVSAKGANLLWLHVPLGVALVALAARAAAAARRLGGGVTPG